MKSSLSLVFAVLILPLLLQVGCGDDSSSGNMDLSASGDLAGVKDMTAAACTTIASWPTDSLFADLTADPLTDYDFLNSMYADGAANSAGTFDSMRIELYHKIGTSNALPRTVMIPADGTYNTCDDCVLIDAEIDPMTFMSNRLYFARSGSLTITKADHTLSGGTMTVSGSNVHLVEWRYDMNNDKPVANGKCYDVTAFNFTKMYVGATDGGTDM